MHDEGLIKMLTGFNDCVAYQYAVLVKQLLQFIYCTAECAFGITDWQISQFNGAECNLVAL